MKLTERDLDALREHPLFGQLKEDELKALFVGGASVSMFAKGQVIHLQHEPCSQLELLLNGSASVQRIDEGGSVLRIAAFSSGDILGANLLFAHRNVYPYTVIAEAETRVLRLNRDVVLCLGQRSLPFLSALLTVVSNRTQLLTDMIDTISRKTIRQRITDLLLFEHGAQGANPIRLPATKKDMAERLGMQRTSLSRELNRMRGEGLIAFAGRVVHLTGLLDRLPTSPCLFGKENR